MADYWTAGAAAETNGSAAPAAATTDAPMEDEILVSIMLILRCLSANKVTVSTFSGTTTPGMDMTYLWTLFPCAIMRCIIGELFVILEVVFFRHGKGTQIVGGVPIYNNTI